ncbi:uncharacterized protein BO66DRAFT_467563 [Aspergillus aculeatinus CBS 121060]|uniref:Uncharacterized protein n=1 Tax=Aspergillus aculeatinus CBS 121060 TaxID=1448322 RepID=A0ACD1HMT3_9EURO|nr:hypothetical protein BO66DRAFT_467563 [Aspergillus aculeatinus CBS 121060]RAH74913.1 hypothetical protein BO66DRAFT_467563 [Aspergillus aculeatinus CBS 121060]
MIYCYTRVWISWFMAMLTMSCPVFHLGLMPKALIMLLWRCKGSEPKGLAPR